MEEEIARRREVEISRSEPTTDTSIAITNAGNASTDGKTVNTYRVQVDGSVSEQATSIAPHPVTGTSVREPKLRFPSKHNFMGKTVPNWKKYLESELFRNENHWIPEETKTFLPHFQKQVEELNPENLKNSGDVKNFAGSVAYNDALYTYLAAMERDSKYARASNRWLKKIGWRYKFVNQGVTDLTLHINGVGKGDSLTSFADQTVYTDETNDELPSSTSTAVRVNPPLPPVDEADITVQPLPTE